MPRGRCASKRDGGSTLRVSARAAAGALPRRLALLAVGAARKRDPARGGEVPRRACDARCGGRYSLKALVMLAAAFLPAPMARMTVAAPVTMSPPAQMRGSVVWPVSSSATM